MDINKLNGKVVKMANDLMRAKPSMGLGLACSAVHFKMANIASQLRLKVDVGAGFGSAVSNFYGLSLSSSGSGKSVGVTLLDSFYFSEAFEYIKKDVFPKFKQKCEAQLEKDGIERVLHTWTPKLSTATHSGLYANSETYYLCKFGGINIQLDELGDAITAQKELFEILLECYNNGDFPAQAKRSDSEALDIDGISVNFYTFGDPTKLTAGDNVEANFQALLKTGYGRRFIFSQDENVEVKMRTPKEIVKEMQETEQIKKDRVHDRAKIKELITVSNMNKTLLLTQEAMLAYATIQCEGENYVRENKGLSESVVSDMLNRTFKTAKLASIYAFFDESDVVTEEHMHQAFEIVKDSSRVLRSITTIKAKHERLLDAMLNEASPCTSQHLLTFSFIPASYTKKILEYIDLAQELASEKGYIWNTTTRKGVTYYEVKKKDAKTEKVLDIVDEKEKEDVVVIEAKRERTQEELIALLSV